MGAAEGLRVLRRPFADGPTEESRSGLGCGVREPAVDVDHEIDGCVAERQIVPDADTGAMTATEPPGL